MANGQVKLGAMGDAGGDYDAKPAARSGQDGGAIYEPTEYPGAALSYKFPVSKPEAPVCATADEITKTGKTAL